MGLTENKRKLLSDFVDNKCEECHKHEDKVGKLEPHRIRRGNMGGIYELRNIKVVCSKCHKSYHSNEEGIGGR